MTRFRFTTLANARSFQGRCHQAALIVLGDNDEFWVVSPAEGERLTRAGYEYAA